MLAAASTNCCWCRPGNRVPLGPELAAVGFRAPMAHRSSGGEGWLTRSPTSGPACFMWTLHAAWGYKAWEGYRLSCMDCVLRGYVVCNQAEAHGQPVHRPVSPPILPLPPSGRSDHIQNQIALPCLPSSPLLPRQTDALIPILVHLACYMRWSVSALGLIRPGLAVRRRRLHLKLDVETLAAAARVDNVRAGGPSVCVRDCDGKGEGRVVEASTSAH